MADGPFTWELQGLDELGRRLNALAQSMGKKVSGRATAASARVVKDRAKQNAPKAAAPHETTVGGQKITVEPGNLQRSIILKRVRLNKALTSEHIVTVRQKPSGKGPGAFYARFVEYGTVKMAPHAYLRPAIINGKDQAVTAMTDTLRAGIDKAVAEVAK